MSEPNVMCGSCPFRASGEERDTLTRWTRNAPDEFWPCHESDPEGLCLGDDCVGHEYAKRTTVNV